MGENSYIPHAPAGMLSSVVIATVVEAVPNFTNASTVPMLIILTIVPWQLSATFELTELALIVDDAAQGVKDCACALDINRDNSQNIQATPVYISQLIIAVGCTLALAPEPALTNVIPVVLELIVTPVDAFPV